ncbi:MAG: hypothetical protein AB7O74_15020 [Candidatus Nanopelagicales bacterium]|uniref:hypothetical protein n=1 Tax=Pseudonocardia sp. TaxID=60912 RepID=UPI003D101CB4
MSTSGGTTGVRAAGLKAALIAAAVAYVLCLFATAMAAFVVVNAAEDTCGFSEEGWGRWGEDSWSWFPLGQTCTYEVPLTQADESTVIVRHVDPPSPFVTTTLVLLVVAPAAGAIGWRLRGQRAA